MNKLEGGQIVLCTVTKIIGTVVFVEIDEYGLEGTITFSEIAPGRIRNIREYAFPGKKIVCKILNIKPEVIELSFRRVKVNERNDFNERGKKEKSYNALIRTMTGEKSEKVISSIKEKYASLGDFLEVNAENKAELEKYLGKEAAEKIASILKEKKVKEIEVSKKFSLSSKAANGIVAIKKLIRESLGKIENCEISYLGASRYMAKIKSKDPKHADSKMNEAISYIEENSKKNNCVFGLEKD